jgi:small subunit ribosomal protein S8
MYTTDPIGDMFTRIRNAILIKNDEVLIPFSKFKHALVKILKEEGFIKFYEIVAINATQKNLKLGLRYAPDGRPLMSNLKRVSRPGKRIYVQKSQIPRVLNGLGLTLVSTSKGIFSGRTARLNNVGGELIGIVS